MIGTVSDRASGPDITIEAAGDLDRGAGHVAVHFRYEEGCNVTDHVVDRHVESVKTGDRLIYKRFAPLLRESFGHSKGDSLTRSC